VTEAQTASTPALDQAVVLAKNQFETWLKDNVDRELNGRQRDLIARVALEIMYPLVKVALFNDLADGLEATGLIDSLFTDMIRAQAEAEMEARRRVRTGE
jgi:hypothetical protein